MKKILRNKQGFALVELLIVVIALSVIAGVGYVVIRHTLLNSGKSDASVSSGAPSKVNTDITKEACVKALCFQMPKTWSLSNATSSTYNIASSNQTAALAGCIYSYGDPCPTHYENEPDATISISLSPANGATSVQQWWINRNSVISGGSTFAQPNSAVSAGTIGGQPAVWDGDYVTSAYKRPKNLPNAIPDCILDTAGCDVLWSGNIYDISYDNRINLKAIHTDDQQAYAIIESMSFK